MICFAFKCGLDPNPQLLTQHEGSLFLELQLLLTHEAHTLVLVSRADAVYPETVAVKGSCDC